MRLIDDKGRLLGLINIVDLAVILLLAAVATRVGRNPGCSGSEPKLTKDSRSSTAGRRREMATADALAEGDTIFNTKSNAVLGKLVRKSGPGPERSGDGRRTAGLAEARIARMSI